VLIRQLSVLWGKSAERAGGRTHLLLGHMLDTAMVAEQMWLHYMSPSVKEMLARVAGGGDEAGLRLFMWLCGVHDWGKATPAFQSQNAAGAAAVRASGLGWDEAELRRSAFWRHDKAGAVLARKQLVGWDRSQVGWVWPLIGGHHGEFPGVGELNLTTKPSLNRAQGNWPDSPWPEVQRAVVELFTRACGFEGLDCVQPELVPSKAQQLALSGLIVMADWIASNSGENRFTGLDDLGGISVRACRERAERVWRELGLRGGWGANPVPMGDPVRGRFGDRSRASQRLLVDVVREMQAPGLVIVEAPMGEGKTKAALAAVEVLAARFGLDGLYVGMPTQATSDPMFGIVHSWAGKAFSVEVAAQTVLLHGKRRFNRLWDKLTKVFGPAPDVAFAGVDEYGEPVGAFGSWDGCCEAERRAPAEWFLGPKRGLLAGLVVGTVDQLLYAATRTRHVMLRFAGLAGKVVLVDEVHAADVYMRQFLGEALYWLGQARVPVVLLSATLPPKQRRELVKEYLAGARADPHFEPAGLPEPEGYPSVTAAWVDPDAGTEGYLVRHCAPWRAPYPVAVRLLEDAGSEPEAVVDLVADKLSDGGVALVIHNTVDRAQYTYARLKERFGADVVLLHGRLDVEDRADRTERCVNELGDSAEYERPGRRIVVATQVAEQSFDIDADLLVTDIAPVDLLLQRIGRLHRHERPERPAGLREPLVVVTGMERAAAGPRLEGGAVAVYGRARLVRTAALVAEADGGSWVLPGQIPELVAAVYGDDPAVPSAWLADAREADAAWSAEQSKRKAKAERFRLAGRDDRAKPTLGGLHYARTGVRDDEEFDAVVRDGKPTVEVVLVRRRENGGYSALGGTALGANGEVPFGQQDVLDAVVGATVRLPARLTEAARRELVPLPGWAADPWLRYARALALAPDGYAVLGDHRVSYDPDLGLVVDGGQP
jgi:CRISPR-associated endonuclease/helicase Cas3